MTVGGLLGDGQPEFVDRDRRVSRQTVLVLENRQRDGRFTLARRRRQRNPRNIAGSGPSAFARDADGRVDRTAGCRDRVRRHAERHHASLARTCEIGDARGSARRSKQREYEQDEYHGRPARGPLRLHRSISVKSRSESCGHTRYRAAEGSATEGSQAAVYRIARREDCCFVIDASPRSKVFPGGDFLQVLPELGSGVANRESVPFRGQRSCQYRITRVSPIEDVTRSRNSGAFGSVEASGSTAGRSEG